MADDELEAILRDVYAAAAREAASAADDDPPLPLDGPADVELSDGVVSALDRRAVAVRSGAALAARQLLVQGGWVDVLLDVTDAGSAVDVRGTVLGVEEVCAVQLVDGGREVALTTTDDVGEFALLGVERGRYDLIVAGERAEMSAPVDLA